MAQFSRFPLWAALLAALVLVSAGKVEASSGKFDRQTSLKPFSSTEGVAVLDATKAPIARKGSQPSAHSQSGVDEITSIRGGVASSTTQTAILGCLAMAVIEKVVKSTLAALEIKFPAMLGGCIFLFFGLLVTEKISPDAAATAFDFLKPGADLVAKWFSMLFVPGLVLLPLSPSIGNNLEIAKSIVVCVVGFVYTASISAYSVLALRVAQGAVKNVSLKPSKTPSKNVSKPAPAAKPYSAETVSLFTKLSVAMGLLSVLATRSGNDFAKPIETIFLCCFTVASYVWGARLPNAYVKLVHPLVTSSVMVLAVVRVLGIASGVDMLDILRNYKTGSFAPMKVGSGDILLYLCGTGVVSFAVSMYSRRALIFSNLPVLATAMLVSSAGSLLSTAAFVRLISLGGATGALVRLSILSRNVTTALSMAITAILGGDISLAAAFVCLTGVLGGTYGKPLMNKLGITDPITRGLGIGSSSQGLGVAAIADEPDAFPFAAISMVLTAIAATALVSIPEFKKALIKTATGI